MRKVGLCIGTASFALLLALGVAACSSSGSGSSSSGTPAGTPQLQGTYVNQSADGDIASIAFTADGQFVESLATCADGEDNDYDSDEVAPTNRVSPCVVSGTYVYDAKAQTIRLKDGTTGVTSTLSFTVTDTEQAVLETTAPTSFEPLGLVTTDAGSAVADAGSLVSDGGPLLTQCAGASTTDGGGATVLVVKSATIGGTSFSSGGSPSSTANPPSSKLNASVDQQYSQGANWALVYNAVYKKISMDTSPCATFMSTALHMFAGITYPGSFGSNITTTTFPVDPKKTSGIDRIVTASVAPLKAQFQLQANTSGLASFLMTQHWNIVWSADNLQPGDVVFVVPADQARHPAHTYMFHGWVDQCAGFAYVIDNEADAYCDPTDDGFYGYCGADGSGTVLCCKAPNTRLYKRNIKVTTPEPKDMDEQDEKMWFALRAPQ